MMRRFKKLAIDVASLVDSGLLLYDGITNGTALRLSGLPKDVKFVGMQISGFGRRIDILLYSEEFPELGEGEEVPYAELYITKEVSLGAIAYGCDPTFSDSGGLR